RDLPAGAVGARDGAERTFGQVDRVLGGVGRVGVDLRLGDGEGGIVGEGGQVDVLPVPAMDLKVLRDPAPIAAQVLAVERPRGALTEGDVDAVGSRLRVTHVVVFLVVHRLRNELRHRVEALREIGDDGG